MKSLRGLVSAVLFAGALSAAEPLLSVKNIYVLPMSGGLDQYLANRLTREGRYVVVTDPTKADALMTDQIGTAFEDRYKELYPPPAPPEDKAKKDAGKKKDDQSLVSAMSASALGARVSTFSRGKGNVFLVDRASRQVIWSTYLKPRNTTSAEMNHTADVIADRLGDEAGHREKALNKAEKKSQSK